MSTLTTDANGHEIAPLRGLRLCEGCGLVMSEGFTSEGDGDNACSEECMEYAEWQLEVDDQKTGKTETVPITNALIAMLFEDDPTEGDNVMVYWTDWVGDGHSEDALERLLKEPYNWTPNEIKPLEEADA